MFNFRDMSSAELDNKLKKCSIREETYIIQELTRRGHASEYLGTKDQMRIPLNVPKYRYDEFLEILDKQNKRISKISGNDGKCLSVENEEQVTRKIRFRDGTKKEVVFQDLYLAGYFYTKNPGYEFLGHISVELDGSKQYHLNDESIDYSTLPDKLFCHHCKTNRKRKIVFVFRKKGQLFYFGKNCVRFYHCRLAEEIAKSFIALRDEFAKIGFYENPAEYIDFETYHHMDNTIALAMMAYNFNPVWTSIAKAEEKRTWPTSSLIKAIQCDEPTYLHEFRDIMEENEFPVPEYDVDEIKSYLVQDYSDIDKSTDFGRNLHEQLFYENGTLRDICTHAHSRIAWAIFKSINDRKNPPKEKDEAEKKISDYLGSVGENISITIIINKVIPVESYYGSTNLLLGEDSSGNRIKMFSNSRAANRVEGGKEYHISSNVKEHDLYNGIKYTQIGGRGTKIESL